MPLYPDRFANPEDWRILRLLAAYRGLLLLLLLGLDLGGASPYVFDQLPHGALITFVLVFIWPTLVLGASAWARVPTVVVQGHLSYLTDALTIVTLIHLTHGVPNGLAALLITPTVGSALILRPRLALLHAAIGTLLLFGEALLRLPASAYTSAEVTSYGLLGLMLFITAIGASFVAQRARTSEAQAARVGSDLATLERLNARIVESMETAVVVLDEDRRVRRLNAAARLRLACDTTAEGRSVADVSRALDDALRAWDRNPNAEREPLSLAGDHEVLPRFVRLGSAEWAPVLAQLEDLDEIREQAQQLKLAALGRLSAGIAHEIRNPLSAIRQAAQLLAESSPLGDEDRRLLDMIQRHTARIDRIVADVLGLSRSRRAQPQTLLLREFVEQTLADYREAAPRGNPDIDCSGLREGLQVRFDPDHLHQILHNLWHNSFDHGTRAGHAVQVRLEAGRLNPGQRPYLDVIDDGPGVAAAVRDHLFEPFFTTANSGTGLGLYFSRELCEYNQARLAYVPRDVGAQFRIVFLGG